MLYELPNVDLTAELLRLAVIDIRHNKETIVVKTHPGLAPFVGDYIDKESDVNILGCLAGENVVFISCSSIKKIQDTYQLICQKLHFKK